MKFIWRTALVAGTVMAVTGCKLDLTQQLYTLDLLDLAEGRVAGVTAPMTMRIPIRNADECDEAVASVSLVVSGLLTDFSPRRCEEVGMDDYLIADAQIPVAFVARDDMDESAYSFTTELFNVLVFHFDGVRNVSMTEGPLPPRVPAVIDPGLGVYIVVDLNKIELLETRLEEEFPAQNVDLSDSTISIELNNDVRSVVAFSVRNVFMEDVPVQGRRLFELDRRHAAMFSLSNVTSASLMRDGFAPALILHTEK